MSKPTETLRSLLEDELGECRDDDLEDRLTELDDLEARALDERAEEDLAVLDTLASETRYRLVRLLAVAGDGERGDARSSSDEPCESDGELCVCELQPLMDVSDSTVSRSLSVLRENGLVERRKEGTWRYYRATERAKALLDALDSTRGVEE